MSRVSERDTDRVLGKDGLVRLAPRPKVNIPLAVSRVAGSLTAGIRHCQVLSKFYRCEWRLMFLTLGVNTVVLMGPHK